MQTSLAQACVFRWAFSTLNAILHRRGLRKYGGKIQLKSHVQEILLEGGRATGVRLRNGKTIRATKVGALSKAIRDGCLVSSCRALRKCTSNAVQWHHVICNLPEQAVVSNASMWDTLKLLPPGAVPDSYRQQVEQTPANRSFMHLHLGFDAAGILLLLLSASGAALLTGGAAALGTLVCVAPD